MKKILVGFLLFLGPYLHAQIFIAEQCTVSFYSKSKLEDIDAASSIAKPVLNGSNGDIVFKIQNTSFKFKSALMEEHFNENYMESEKYPFSTFKGKINEKIDYSKDGEHDVTVTGKMNIHGVERTETYKGKLSVKGGKVIIHAVMKIKLQDYNIQIPSVVTYNVAEEVDVTVNATMAPYKKS